MKKNLLLVNLVLLTLAAVQIYFLREQWQRYQAGHELSRLGRQPVSRMTQSTSANKPGQVANYSAIVEDFLFALDRSPMVAVDQPQVKPLAPKPVLMGTINIGEEQFALMISADPKESKDYRRLKIGESLSGYTLTKIFDQKVTMMADGTEVEVRLNEPSRLVARDVGPTSQPAGPNVTTVGTASSNMPAQGTAAAQAASQKTPTGVVPVGTVVNGKVKTLVPSPFGPMEAWVDQK